jgi:hypothetical protein
MDGAVSVSAYSVKINLKCASCKTKNATQEVFNRFNESVGKYCLLCAMRRVRDLKKGE